MYLCFYIFEDAKVENDAEAAIIWVISGIIYKKIAKPD